MGLPCPLSRLRRQCLLTSQQFCSFARCSLALTAVDVAALMWLDIVHHTKGCSCALPCCAATRHTLTCVFRFAAFHAAFCAAPNGFLQLGAPVQGKLRFPQS